jgi:hypothetical protein
MCSIARETFEPTGTSKTRKKRAVCLSNVLVSQIHWPKWLVATKTQSTGAFVTDSPGAAFIEGEKNSSDSNTTQAWTPRRRKISRSNGGFRRRIGAILA